MYALCQEVVKIVGSGTAWDVIKHNGYQFYSQFCTRETWDSIVDACYTVSEFMNKGRDLSVEDLAPWNFWGK